MVDQREVIIVGLGEFGSKVVSVFENLLKERSTNMVQKMAREAVNSLESMELYAQNVSFDETVQESLKKLLDLFEVEDVDVYNAGLEAVIRHIYERD